MKTDILRIYGTVVIAIAMIMPIGMVFTGQAAAESMDAVTESTPEMPPVPPYTIYGVFWE